MLITVAAAASSVSSYCNDRGTELHPHHNRTARRADGNEKRERYQKFSHNPFIERRYEYFRISLNPGPRELAPTVWEAMLSGKVAKMSEMSYLCQMNHLNSQL